MKNAEKPLILNFIECETFEDYEKPYIYCNKDNLNKSKLNSNITFINTNSVTVLTDTFTENNGSEVGDDENNYLNLETMTKAVSDQGEDDSYHHLNLETMTEAVSDQGDDENYCLNLTMTSSYINPNDNISMF